MLGRMQGGCQRAQMGLTQLQTQRSSALPLPWAFAAEGLVQGLQPPPWHSVVLAWARLLRGS